MGAWRRGPAKDSSSVTAAELSEPVIDLRGGEARYLAAQPASLYGYDSVVPAAWHVTKRPVAPRSTHRRREQPPPAGQGLPHRFRLLRRFPPLQRVVHYGPIDGRQVEIKLTVANSVSLHSTGIEHSMRELEGRLREGDHLQLLTDLFGRDRRSLGSRVPDRPHTLQGAKREWHKSIVAKNRHGFAVCDNHLVLLEYLSPERDSRLRTFGIAYKRIVVAYEIVIDDVERHPRQEHHTGAW